MGFAFLEDENMDATPMERRKMVTIPQEEFEAILERAAERGARHALADVGLDGSGLGALVSSGTRSWNGCP